MIVVKRELDSNKGLILLQELLCADTLRREMNCNTGRIPVPDLSSVLILGEHI